MGFFTGGLGYIVPFLIVLTVLVFVHELGHYLVARWNGVRIEVFSIGFGPEIFGWTDRVGTRWKFSAVPLGGYVKMFGDADPASQPSAENLERMSDAEKAVSFHHKRLMQRVAVVVGRAGGQFSLRRGRAEPAVRDSRRAVHAARDRPDPARQRRRGGRAQSRRHHRRHRRPCHRPLRGSAA